MERRFSNLSPSDFFATNFEPPLDLAEFGLALVRPDAYKSNKGVEILEAIQTEGFSLVSVKCIVVEPWHFELLYNEKTKLFAPNVWLFEQIYRDTPCIAMVFRRNSASAEGQRSAPEVLNLLKGNSSPSGGPSIGLRERMGRASSFHGVVHCSDTVESLRNDLMALFNAEELIHCFTSLESVSEVCGDQMLRFYLENDEQKVNRFDVVQILVFVVRRILATIYVCHRHFLRLEDRGKVIALFQAYSTFSLELDKGMKFSERVVLLTKFQHGHRADILEGAAISPVPFKESPENHVANFQSRVCRSDATSLLSLLAVFGAYQGFNGLSLAMVGSVLERGGVYLTGWQKCQLWAALTTDLNSDSEWEGRSVYDRGAILGKETP